MTTVVFFDVAGTLIRVRAGVGSQYARVAARFGVDADPKALEREFPRAFRAAPRMAFPGAPAEAVPELHFPGLDKDAARFLVTSRSIKAVGIDTASIDYGQSQLFESHVILFGANVPALENVADLEKLPVKDFMVAALPMKIEGGSGSPLRVAAWW